ncbi:MAG: hypothetical protein SGILL_001065 [Bacillariaceae sp.]
MAPSPTVTEIFSWSDFPILEEDILYGDSYRQKQKTADHEKLPKGCHAGASRPIPGDDEVASKLSKTATSAKNTASTAIQQTRKVVRFDAVHIREHSITVGDHDWCEGTLALTLDWPHTEQPKSMLISDYESLRERQGRTPRGRLPKLEHWQRKQILRRVGGISDEDLQLIEYLEQGRSESSVQRKIGALPRTKTIPNLASASAAEQVVIQ